MKLNKRRLRILLFIIGIIWLGNVIFYYSKKIDGPIFTYTYNNEGRGQVKLSYIMDQDDKDKIESIILPELNNFELNVKEDGNINSLFGLNNNSINDRNSDGSVRYNMHNIDLWTSRNSEGRQLSSIKQDFIITKIKYKTVNGKEGECEIGKIIHKEELFSENYLDRPYHLFSTYGKSSYNDGEAREIFKALDDIKIIGIDWGLRNEFFEYFDIKINGDKIMEGSFPIEISRGQDIDVSIKHCKNATFYEQCSGILKIIARDPEGTEEKMKIDIFISNDKITYNDVDNLLKKRGLN